MQHHYEDQPILWHEVPYNRFSRRAARYQERGTRQGTEQQCWHEQIEQRELKSRGRKGRGETRARPLARGARVARRRHDSRKQLLPAVLLVLAIIFVAIAAFGALSEAPDEATASASTPQAAAVKSTSRDQWIRGWMPYLYQTDPEWADVSYADATIANSGCGPTCLSMVYVYLTGRKDKDPKTMAAAAERGGYVEEGNTRWAFMTEGARQFGLRSRELPADEGQIRAQLEAKHPIIVSVMPGDFTTKGHFIVLESIDAYGRILIRDPNSPERSGQAWELSRIMSQARNFWAFSI